MAVVLTIAATVLGCRTETVDGEVDGGHRAGPTPSSSVGIRPALGVGGGPPEGACRAACDAVKVAPEACTPAPVCREEIP